jgi:DNA invertase Pin-like site-specific DNA recombinase
VRVAIYARVSTDEQNIQQQIDLLKDYCKRNALSFRTYADEGISGSISARPKWQQLLSACERKEFDAILVVKTDRITRSLKYAIEFFEWYKNNSPLKIISLYDSNDLDSSDGYFTFMLNCLLSERELLISKWRSRIGIDRAKKEGKYKGGKVGRSWTNSK